MLEIDGSAGGQVLRTACALSAITKQPCRIFRIRRNRPKPGLMPQHLLGIQALAKLCRGRLEGDKLSSEEINFWPGEIAAEDLHLKIETAGSITLILQTLLPLSLAAARPMEITFEGGATDTFFSPTIDYFRYVFLKILERTGIKVETDIFKRGYYPEGGARIATKIYPSKSGKINLTERGNLKKILMISGAADSLKSKKVAERQLAGIKEIFGRLGLPSEEKIEYYETRSPGSQICLVAEFALKSTDPATVFLGTDNLGKLGKRAEDVGKEAALELLKEQKSGACLDKYSADQILLYLALAGAGSSATVSEVTEHCLTNIGTIEKFLKGKFEIKNNLIIWQSLK
jgi:RNA 3'-terminal phosphate cyclase (GTP)